MSLIRVSLDDATGARLEALVAQSRAPRITQVSRSTPSPEVIKAHPVRGFESEINLNSTITIEVDLPAYLVAGMRNLERKEPYVWREMVSGYLTQRGKTWWQPRLMASLRARMLRDDL